MRLILILLIISNLSYSQPRKALLIGNSDYRYIPNLIDPSAPISKLKEALDDLGFDVEVKYNLNAENLSAEVEKFADRLSRDSVGFFYYSGHGSQLKGVSYLIPTNVDTHKANKVRYHALSIDEVLSNLQRANNRVNMLFFDACRDVPVGTRGGTKGLGNPTNKPNGSLIVYATEAGKVAQDNTIFISELTKAIKQPNKEILQIGNSLSNSVAIQTNNAQIPEMYSKRLPSGFVLSKIELVIPPPEIYYSNKYITIGNLMWQDEPYTKAEKKAYDDYTEHNKVLKWESAKSYCSNLSLGGFNDWYLPSKEELGNLYKSKDKLKNISSDYYWSSTTSASYTSYAWYVSFYYGYMDSNGKNHSYYVRCVRVGQ